MRTCIDTSKEYGLVLEGGGAKGAFQIGAWKALIQAGVKITAIAGTSVGGLNGALIASGSVEEADYSYYKGDSRKPSPYKRNNLKIPINQR